MTRHKKSPVAERGNRAKGEIKLEFKSAERDRQEYHTPFRVRCQAKRRKSLWMEKPFL